MGVGRVRGGLEAGTLGREELLAGHVSDYVAGHLILTGKRNVRCERYKAGENAKTIMWSWSHHEVMHTYQSRKKSHDTGYPCLALHMRCKSLSKT